MLKLSEELGISVLAREKTEDFEIEVVSGISPCRAGGYSIEAAVKGIREKEAAGFINVLGNTVYAEDLGMLLVKTGTGTVKFFSNGNLLASSETKEKAVSLFKEAAKQFTRLSRCTGCGICVKACPVGAASLEGKIPHAKTLVFCAPVRKRVYGVGADGEEINAFHVRPKSGQLLQKSLGGKEKDATIPIIFPGQEVILSGSGFGFFHETFHGQTARLALQRGAGMIERPSRRSC